MIYRTISLCQGKGSIGHNNRVFHTKNTTGQGKRGKILISKAVLLEYLKT